MPVPKDAEEPKSSSDAKNVSTDMEGSRTEADQALPEGEESKKNAIQSGDGDSEKDQDGYTRIGWDGADDPQNPKNLSFRRRWFITSIVR